MKKALRLLLFFSLLTAFVGCAATVPVKVAAKTTKLGVKATKTTVKAGAAVIPDRKTETDSN